MALDLEDYHPSVLLHCWLGHLTCKIVFEMTYNVSSGTLNPTMPYHTTTATTKCSDGVLCILMFSVFLPVFLNQLLKLLPYGMI